MLRNSPALSSTARAKIVNRIFSAGSKSFAQAFTGLAGDLSALSTQDTSPQGPAYHACRCSRRIAWSSAEEEGGTVARRERRQSACGVTGGAQVGQQIANGQRHADGVIGQRPARGCEDGRSSLHAAAGQGNIGGDDDGAGTRRSAIQLSASSGPAGTATRSISGCCGTRMKLLATTETGKLVPLRDAVNLVLHRAGIGVDINTDGICHRLSAQNGAFAQSEKGCHKDSPSDCQPGPAPQTQNVCLRLFTGQERPCPTPHRFRRSGPQRSEDPVGCR